MRHQQQTPTTGAPTRRRPAWNSYLTDSTQYRLNEHQQLTRQLQQLSTAHFSSRSPSVQQQQYRRSTTPSRYSNSDTNNSSIIIDSDDHYTLNNTPAASAGGVTPVGAMRERPGSSDSARRRKIGASVSFKLDHDERETLDQSQKVNLQGELATLERMLVELEVETATLNQKEREEPPVSPYAYELQHEQRSPYRHDDENEELYAHPEEEYSDDRAASEDEDNFESEGDEIEEQDPDTSRQQQQVQGFHESESPGNTSSVVEEDVKLSQVCYKSLSIGMHLAKKMDQLSRELELERKVRMDHELKIEVLEQEVRSTRAKCNYLDAKYQNVLSQVDDMREALVATEGAVHRLTKQHAADRSRSRTSHRHSSTTPTTPKQAKDRDVFGSKSIVTNGFHEQDGHSTIRRPIPGATPKRSPKTKTSYRLRGGEERQQQQENEAGLINTSEPLGSRR